MAEIAGQAKRRAKKVTQHGDEARTSAEKTIDQAVEAVLKNPASVRRELSGAVQEAAIEVLKPVMRNATTAAAKYAVTRGPSLIMDKVEGAGGASALAKGVTSKGSGIADAVGGVASKLGLTGKGKGKSPSGTGRGRRLPVQETIDVGVDIETAYDQFTQFEDWPKFMHRVERIEQRDDTTLMWHENIWGIRRAWEAQIIDQVKCARIKWRSTGGPQTIGVVTFHKLSDQLTRIMITLDFQPKGLFEKTASGMRISRRALKSDLMRFKGFVELRDEATGEWRGTIQDGEVVDEQDEREPREDEEYEDEDEPVAYEDDEDAEDEEEYEDDEEEEEEPLASEEEESRGDGEDRSTETEDEEPVKPPRPRARRRRASSAREKAKA